MEFITRYHRLGASVIEVNHLPILGARRHAIVRLLPFERYARELTSCHLSSLFLVNFLPGDSFILF